MSELKPCPFCGADAELYQTNDTRNFRVICQKCPASVGRYWYHRKADAIKAWNRRADNEH